MRSRLVHTLSLWLLGAVCASVLALGGFTAWNLRQGFSTYLQTRDLERLDLFVQVLTQDVQRSGGAQAWRDKRLDMPALLRAHAVLDGVPAPTQERARPLGPPADRPHGEGPPPPRRPPPSPGGAAPFGTRVAVFIPGGQGWVGPPLPPGATGLIERPVVWEGQEIAVVKLLPMAPLPEAHEVQFLRAQYLGIAGVAAALLLLALACAWWLARQWARPLVAVQRATERIAHGELGVRLPTGRSDEIGDVMRNVNHMAEGLQRMEGTRRRWMADMSHELRTPLAVLRGEIEALVDGVRPLSPQAMRSLREDVLRLGALVDDLHLLAMADLQALPCRFADVDAVDVVQDVLDRCQRRATDAGLTLDWAEPPPTSLPVCWDERRVDQLLVNLIENSLRYTDAPGQVRVSLHATATAVRLSVADSAPGVPAADLPRLFEPLYRADLARSRHTGGSGLGLAIAQAIVASHRGRIEARASTLGGLCVEVVLPLQAGPTEAPPATPRPAPAH
jgi:two-component system sensor histidine kinase BaeS